jgi:hypothetical protein
MKSTVTQLKLNTPMKLTFALLSSLLLGASPVSAAPDAYPLKTCVVSGNELGSMGKPITKVYNDQEIKLCCKPCIKKFEANPAKYLGKLKK